MAIRYVTKEHQNLTANGNGFEAIFSSGDSANDRELIVHCSGTFGGGTLQLQFRANNSTWKDLSNAAFTGNADKVITLPGNTEIRAVLSGATSPSIFYQYSTNGKALLGLNF